MNAVNEKSKLAANWTVSMSKAAIFELKIFFETRENEKNLLKKLKPYEFPHLTTIQYADERCKRKYKMEK